VKHRRRIGRRRCRLSTGGRWSNEQRVARRVRRRSLRLRRRERAANGGTPVDRRIAARRVRRSSSRSRQLRRRPVGGGTVPGVQQNTRDRAKGVASKGDGGSDSDGGGGDGEGGPPAGGGLRVVIRYVEPQDPAAYEAGLSDARQAFLEGIYDELKDGRLKL
jgi:hypothetical protein